MISREFIFNRVKSHHVIALHMKGRLRLDNLTLIVYIVHDIILSNQELKQIQFNLENGINTDGVIRIKATRTSNVDNSLKDEEMKDYTINTKDISYWE